MGEVLLYSILFLSGRQIPSLLGNRCLGETEPALEGGHNKGPDLRRHGPSLIQTTLLGGGGVCLLKTIRSIVYLKYLL